MDESGEIRATAFNAEVDKFYNLIDVNKVRSYIAAVHDLSQSVSGHRSFTHMLCWGHTIPGILCLFIRPSSSVSEIVNAVF